MRFRSLLLEGSWVVISGVISKVAIVITHIRGLITHTYNYPMEPPSKDSSEASGKGSWVYWGTPRLFSSR